jgi:HEAT repeat protein
MATPQEFAALFTRTLDLFRDPGAKEDQKAQFRSLVVLLKKEALTIVANDGSKLTVNGAALDRAPYNSLLQRLEFHSVTEIRIPADPPLAETFELFRLLADQPGDEDIASRLRSSGARAVSVAVQAVVIETPAPRQAPQPPPIPHPPPPPPPPPSSQASPVPHSIQDTPGFMREGVSESAAFSPAAATSRSTTDLIKELIDKPSGPHAGDLLAVLGRQLETAMKNRRTPQALAIVAGVVKAEQQVADASRKRQYSIALKRMYTKALLEAIAEVANHPSDREAALLVLRRAGEDGVEVLLDLLVAAPTIEERRGLFMALTGMKEGTDQLVHMLGHPQWFVARNVAELAGELGLQEAVPALGQQLNHGDERVRKAAALALSKIGSSAAAEPLRRALRDVSPEVRIQAALGVGKKSGALAMPLVAAMEEEQDENVERELILALGRIASAAAVQALIKFAQPGGRLFGRKPVGLRVAAVEALRLAATPAAIGTLEGLTDDGDKGVRTAAQSALADLKRK